MKRKTREEISKKSNRLLETTGGTGFSNNGCVCIEVIAAKENFVQKDLFLYYIEIADGSRIGELVRRSEKKCSDTERLLGHKLQICCVSIINALFKKIRCSPGFQFIKKPHKLEPHLTTCMERIRYAFPKNMYQLRETLFDELE